jgi:hypothetical protein
MVGTDMNRYVVCYREFPASKYACKEFFTLDNAEIWAEDKAEWYVWDRKKREPVGRSGNAGNDDAVSC